MKELVRFTSLRRVLSRAGQNCKMWEMSSKLLHKSDKRQEPCLLEDQWLHSPSVLYLPEIMSACTVAMDTLVGDDPAVVQSGCGEDRDMKERFKNFRESRDAASALSLCSQ